MSGFGYMSRNSSKTIKCNKLPHKIGQFGTNDGSVHLWLSFGFRTDILERLKSFLNLVLANETKKDENREKEVVTYLNSIKSVGKGYDI